MPDRVTARQVAHVFGTRQSGGRSKPAPLRGNSNAVENAGSGYGEANRPHFLRRYTGGRSKRRPYGEIQMPRSMSTE